MTARLDYSERAGTLVYMRTDIEADILEGSFWLSLDGARVGARRKGGRNRFLLCSTKDIISFRPKGSKA